VLQFASTNALTGLNLRFGEGATLKVDPNTADEGLKAFGAVLTGDVAFPADGKIPVALASAIEPETTVGVLTVPDALAGTVLGRLSKPKGVENNPKLVARSNRDGTTTIAVTTKKTGFTLIFR